MIEMMITSSVLILMILLLRRLTNGKISMRLRYALWLAAALRLLLPVSLGNSVLSVMNLLPRGYQQTMTVREAAGGWTLSGVWSNRGAGEEMDTVSGVMSMGGEKAFGEASVPTEMEEGIEGAEIKDAGQKQKTRQAGTSSETTAGLASGIDKVTVQADEIPEILWIVWMAGTLAVGTYMVVSQIRFRRILRRRSRIVREKEIPQEMADRLMKHRIRVYQTDGLASPCLVGGNIYVDAGLVKERRKLVHVLAHEYCHAVQFDSFWAFLRSALAAIYWFHPLVWAAAFAARQDSELACDEAVIGLLGEEERFAYGRTLLYLLSGGNCRIDCAGTALTMEGRKRDVKERVRMIAGNTEHRRWPAVIVVMTMLMVCGCAFTGSEQEKDVWQEAKEQTPPGENTSEALHVRTDRQQTVGDASDEEFARIRKEYEDVVGAFDAQEQTLGQAQQDYAFLSVLEYQGVMEGKDDSELALNRILDYQAYYDYLNGKQGEQGGAKTLPENGWYLICRNEEAQISLYGLYTQEFGPRGIKTLIGEDVNTYDIAWCPSHMNEDSTNIRVLEKMQDGLPEKFVFKILAENTSDREIWKLYSGLRYETGTVELEELTPQMYRDWADRNLSFEVSASGDQILITYEGDMVLAPLDISAYQDQKVEEVMISPDVAGFQLESETYAGEAHEGQDGDKGVELHLAVGLKLEGLEDIWYDGLQMLTVQVLCHSGQEQVFVLQNPNVTEQGVLRSLTQERKLDEIREGKDRTEQE